jgi:polysaccharide biosynthesis transport protein
MEERSVHLTDYLTVVKRRRWWLITPAVLGVLVGIGLAVFLPREYQSYTTLAVTTPTVSSDLVRSSPTDLADRVRAISHELLSRPVLERVAREEGLAAEASSIDAAVAMIRSNSAVSTPKAIASGARTGPDTFIVTYAGPTPEMTQRIANRLATVFIDEHSKIREARAEDTSAFLANQLDQSQTRLKALEERLRQIKEANIGRLPEQTQANLQMVSGLRQQQDTAAASLRTEQDRLAMVERQIEAMRQGAAEAPLSRSPDGLSAQQRVIKLRRELDDALATYTEKHPEVQRIKSDLAAAEAAAQAESQKPAAERQPALMADPTYRQLVAERDSVRLRIRDLERTGARVVSEIARYQGRVESAPMVEQKLISLNREYELEKQQFNALSERHQSALMNEDLERRRAGEQFAVLYPAFRPSDPSKPNVPRVLIFSILGGIVLGGLAAVGREYLDRSVHDAGTLQQEFEIPVLAEIPHIAGQ